MYNAFLTQWLPRGRMVFQQILFFSFPSTLNDDDLVVRGLFNIYLHVNNEWLKFKVNELKDIVMEIHFIFIYKYNIVLYIYI